MSLCTIHLSNIPENPRWKTSHEIDRTIVDPVASTNNWNQITKRSWSNYYHLSRHAFKSQLNLTHRIEIQSVVQFSWKGERERRVVRSRVNIVLIVDFRVFLFLPFGSWYLSCGCGARGERWPFFSCPIVVETNNKAIKRIWEQIKLHYREKSRIYNNEYDDGAM